MIDAMTDLPIVNISGYQFVSIEEALLPTMRMELKKNAMEQNLKGTILLSHEGINIFLAGMRDEIENYKNFLFSYAVLHKITFKESFTDYQPFNRLLVRLKKEIIPFGRDCIQPEKQTAPHLSPEEFKKWYEEKRDMVVLDTRNDFEVALGTFQNAIDLDLKKFRDFPEAIEWLPENIKQKPIVTFCTGGIRCEKAAELMRQKGFDNVYQLDGGILNYFEKCGGAFYQGECFVFDHRVAVDTKLQETKTAQCFDCRTPLQKNTIIDGKCPACGSESISKKAA
ncbi:MAG: hypothetical protein ACD_29C00175G0002 [uncultured bacterium]|nr:MAG: hypothetical protein ACD_29C00175G0002 [uncultured bacterium]